MACKNAMPVKLRNFSNCHKSNFMFKSLVFSLLFLTFSFRAVDAVAALSVESYNSQEKVSGVVNDKAIIGDLKNVLGKDYSTFIGNFDVFGEPHKTADGGLFIEGWLQDLYLENASAFVIYPDGTIYSAWVVPESNVIHYKSSVKGGVVNKDIKLWAARFKNMNFGSVDDKREENADTEYFSTKSFLIKLATVCPAGGYCNDATYHATRKSDGAAVTLKGTATREDCGRKQCPVISYKFKNGKTVYMLSKLDNSLVIIENNKVIMQQNGSWQRSEN